MRRSRVGLSGAGWAVGGGEAERRSRADLCKQAGLADGCAGFRDRRGSQPAHHPRPHLANPVVLCSHRGGDPGVCQSARCSHPLPPLIISFAGSVSLCTICTIFITWVISIISQFQNPLTLVIFSVLCFPFRRAWIGSARASTPRRSSSVSILRILGRRSDTHARACAHTRAQAHDPCDHPEYYYNGILPVNVPLIHHGPDDFNTEFCLQFWYLTIYIINLLSETTSKSKLMPGNSAPPPHVTLTTCTHLCHHKRRSAFMTLNIPVNMQLLFNSDTFFFLTSSPSPCCFDFGLSISPAPRALFLPAYGTVWSEVYFCNCLIYAKSRMLLNDKWGEWCRGRSL